MSLKDPFPTARFIKEIGRGPNGARSLSRSDAHELYAAMLAGRVADLELGALLLAMRIKGESVDELAGFLDAAAADLNKLPSPAGPYAPVVIPSYNGARKMANLTPLLALLLAREGVPVLVHGVLKDPNRVTTAEIFAELGIALASDVAAASAAIAKGQPAFMHIDALAPRMAALLALRAVLGVRSSTHTLVKLLQPFEGKALRLVSYTHAEYYELLTQYFGSAAPHAQGDAFIMRGTEGETVANAQRAHQIDWFHQGQLTRLVEREAAHDDERPLPEQRDAATTAAWIRAALAGREPIPHALQEQISHCLRVAHSLRI